MEFKLSDEIINEIRGLIESQQNDQLHRRLAKLHFSDIAEIMERLDYQDAIHIFNNLDSDISADTLLEVSSDTRKHILEQLTPKEIAKEIDELNTDDAVDLIAEIPNEIRHQVINCISKQKHAYDIIELLRYDEDSAGGLMAKEYLKVNENWNVFTCIRNLRRQAKTVQRVHSIYVVDDRNNLKGRLSLKDLLTTSTRTPIKDFYIHNVDYVNVNTEASEVARKMQKYDLEAIPVIDDLGRLVGRITIDDIVDVIKESADQDFQMATGLTQDVEADDTIFEHARARLPWLFLALIGGFVAVKIASEFGYMMEQYGVIFFFTPLIAAMAGNVGVQSSAIVVQALAKNAFSGSIFTRLLKEFILSLVNGLILALILIITMHLLLNIDFIIGFAVAISLIMVNIIASLIGTFVPFILDRFKINPALATGPFITTGNDIVGILIYFYIAKLIIGF